MKSLGEVAEVISGQSPKGANYNTRGKGTPFYQGKKEFGDRLIGEPTTWTTQVTRLAKANDILMSVRAPVGPVNLATQDICIGRGLAAIRPSAALDTAFLFHYLVSQRHQIEGNEGAVFASINRTQIEAIPVPVPPLAEQRRIVAILDEAFEAIAAAKANAERNIRNAEEVFEGQLQRVFMHRDLEWTENPLGEIADFKNGLNFSRSSAGQSVPMVGVADFQNNDFVPLNELEEVTVDGELDGNYAIQPNDILTVRSNGSKQLVGRCMLVGAVDEVVSYSGFIIRIRFDTKKIVPRFLLHFMKCQATRNFLTASGGGANISNINQEKLASLRVPLPKYSTQLRAATSLDTVRDETRRLASVYSQTLAATDELKASLLHQAFSGQL
jgi:type I restriction enzyme S subunit